MDKKKENKNDEAIESNNYWSAPERNEKKNPVHYLDYSKHSYICLYKKLPSVNTVKGGMILLLVNYGIVFSIKKGS